MVSLTRRIKLAITDRWFHYVTARRYMAQIKHGDIVVDCGANIGVYTEEFLKRGAVVHAFEPHPVAFDILSKRVAGIPGVNLHNKAVSDHDGVMKLYLKANDDSIGASQSASLMSGKDNISLAHSVDVEVVRLASFLSKLGRVRFLKMDIEGAEYDVLPDLIKSGVHKSIDQIVVETHERSPRLRPLHDRLLQVIKQHKITNMDLGWH